MKNKFYLPVTLLTLTAAMSACSSEELREESTAGKRITITATDFKSADASRTSINIADGGGEFTWAKNDTVGIFPNEGAQAYFPMVSGAGTKSATFDGGGWALKESATYAAYYPFIKSFDANKQALPVSLRNQLQVGNASTAHLGNYDYMAAVATQSKDGSVDFIFKHLTCLFKMTLDVPMKGDVTAVNIKCNDPLFVEEGYFDLTSDKPEILSDLKSNMMSLSLKDVKTTVDHSSVEVYFMMAPADFTGKPLEVEIINNGRSFKQTFKLGKLEAGLAYRVNFTATDVPADVALVNVEKPGTLSDLNVGELLKNSSRIKFTGLLNGDDIRYLRHIYTSGSYSLPKFELDLYDARIVKGGGMYFKGRESYSDSYEYYTEDDVIGKAMFESFPFEKIILPRTAKKIKSYAFGSRVLKSVVVPDDLSYIDDYAFRDCDQLESFTIPKNIKTIGNGAFFKCKSLSAFYGPHTTADHKCVIVNDELKAYALGAPDTNYDIPHNVKYIREYAFVSSKLTSLNIPESVLEIGDMAFAYSSLKSLTIPSSVVHMALGVVYGCDKIEAFYGKYATSDNKCLVVDDHVAAYAKANMDKELVLTADVSFIGGNVFSEAPYLESVKICSDRVKTILAQAFNNCKKLKKVEIADNVTEIGYQAFLGCKALESIKLPKNLQRIEVEAFKDCLALTSVDLPKRLTEINNYAFYQCESLKTLTIPENVTYVGEQIYASASWYHRFSGIYCWAVNPPATASENVVVLFDNGKQFPCDIYVPEESVNLYKSHPAWGKNNILPIPKDMKP